MNSTPPRAASTMRLTALLPPPPTPTTLIFAPVRFWVSSVSLSVSSRIIASWTSEELFENSTQASGHAAEGPGTRAPGLGHSVAVRIQRQTHGGAERRTVHVVGHAAHADRAAPANRQIENLLGDLRHALENRPAAGEHDPRVQRLLVARAANLVPHEVEDLLGARLQNLREDAPRHQPRLAAADAGDFDRLVLVDHRGERAAVLALHLFRVRNRRAQPDGDVVGEVIAA